MTKAHHNVMWDRNSPYAYRNDNLRALGFKSYRAYLNSDLWVGIRRRVFDRDGHKCVRCKWTKKLQVHHRAYDPATLAGDNINSLSTVCGRCHTKAERPTDFTRGRYNRLQESSEQIVRPLAKRLLKAAKRRET